MDSFSVLHKNPQCLRTDFPPLTCFPVISLAPSPTSLPCPSCTAFSLSLQLRAHWQSPLPGMSSLQVFLTGHSAPPSVPVCLWWPLCPGEAEDASLVLPLWAAHTCCRIMKDTVVFPGGWTLEPSLGCGASLDVPGDVGPIPPSCGTFFL